MKRLCSVLFFLLLFYFGYSQTSVDSLIKVGIDHHDNGQYDAAIKAYDAALELDPGNVLINYEKGLTMINKKDFEGSIQQAEIVLNSDKEELHLAAILIKGSSLDYLGRTKESIKLFENAIAQFGDDYLLYYNLGYNYYFSGNLEKAESTLIKGILAKTDHASSHLILGYTMIDQREKIESLMALYFFLLLEPDTDRADDAFAKLRDTWKGDISEGEDGNIVINLSLPDDGDKNDPMNSLELMLSLLELGATEVAEETQGKEEISAEEEFYVKTSMLFGMLNPDQESGNAKKKKKSKKKDKLAPREGFWWDFYASFFYDMNEKGHTETFCYYILLPRSDIAETWLEEHQEKVDAFIAWLQES